MDLRAFSVKQPWASLLMAGTKRFEVRTWGPKQEFCMVHASSGKARGIADLRQEPPFAEALRLAHMTDEKSWPQSAILRAVEIKRVWEPYELPDDLSDLDEFLCGSTEEVFLWEIGLRWSFATPIRCDGKLNMWRPAAELHAAIDEQLTAAHAPFRIEAN